MSSFIASLDPFVEIKGSDDQVGKDEKKRLLAYEDGHFTCVSVPNDYLDVLCFDIHEGVNEFSDTESKLCCAQETSHVHAHIHRGDVQEEVLLEQCCQDLCVLPPVNDLSKCPVKNENDPDLHEHNIECGHKRISHGDHFDWLVPMPDGSFLVQHSHGSDNGGSHYHENGRLVKMGAARASLRKRHPHKVDIFDYRLPTHGGQDSRSLHRDETSSTPPSVSGPSTWKEVRGELTPPKSTLDVPSLTLNQENLKRTVLDVLGICCPSEVPLIRRILEPLPGVVEVAVNVISKTTTVIHDPFVTSEVILVKALNEASLDASLHLRGKSASVKRWPSPWVALCGILLVVGFFKYVYEPLKFVAIAAVAVGAPKIALKSYGALKRYVLDINSLMLLAVIGAIALGDYLEAATVVFLFSIAEWLESQSTEKARLALESVCNMTPETAILFETGLRVATEDVEVGTYLAIKTGETVPIDGVVVEGNGAVDESSLTGESVAVSKSPGMEVWAGTINTTGFMKIRTTALASDSAVSRMARLVEDAQSHRSRSELFIESFAKYYTPIVIVVAILMIIIPLAVRASNARHWIYLALVLLVVACPCALVISTPVTIVCGIAQAARRGFIVKGGEHLETLAKVKIVAFDKTGTLTQGRFQVSNFLPLTDGYTWNQILYWVGSVENLSSHPLAPAVVSYSRIRGVDISPAVLDFQTLSGEGVSGGVDRHTIQIGNERMLKRLGLTPGPESLLPESWEAEGGTVSYVVVDGVLVAMFSVADSPRPEASEAVGALRHSGLRVAMLTGDNQGSARCVASAIDPSIEVHAQLLPEDKVSIITELKTQGKVTMVGDGINDAPALAASDVGIAMGVAGSAMAMETADASLMQNDLRQIPRAIALARKCRIKLIQNIGFSLFTKLLVIILSAAGYAYLWVALLADVGTCLLVVANSLLILERVEGNKRGKGGARDCVSESLGLNSNANENCCEDGEHCTENATMPSGDGCNKKEGCCDRGIAGHGNDSGCGGNHLHSHPSAHGLKMVKKVREMFHRHHEHKHDHDHGHSCGDKHGHEHGHEEGDVHGHHHNHGDKRRHKHEHNDHHPHQSFFHSARHSLVKMLGNKQDSPTSACNQKGGTKSACCGKDSKKEIEVDCCGSNQGCSKSVKVESCCNKDDSECCKATFPTCADTENQGHGHTRCGIGMDTDDVIDVIPTTLPAHMAKHRLDLDEVE